MSFRPAIDYDFMSIPNDPHYPIYQGVRALAGVDDGAEAKDGSGFNKYDTEFGNSLAKRDWNYWTPKMKWSAWRMLSRYRVQLMKNFGIDYSKIPEPTIATQVDQAIGSVVAQAEKKQDPIKSISIDEKNNVIIRFWGKNFKEILADVKEIPGTKFVDDDPKFKHWMVPLSPASAVGINAFARKWQFLATDEVKARVKEMATMGERLEVASKQVSGEIEVPGFGGNGLVPMPFQQAGIIYGDTVERFILGDDMGLGKTIQALGVIQLKDAYPALIVVPASIKINWWRECKRWISHKKAIIVDSKITADELVELQPDIVIINYDILARAQEQLAQVKWFSIVFDEGHRLKNSRAQRSQAALELAEEIPIRMVLTGTPILNRPNELVHPLKVIGRLKDVSPKGAKYFLGRYCGGWDGYGFNGATHTEELHKVLRQTCMIRRVKEGVLKELPPIWRSIIPLEIDNWWEYSKAEADIIQWVGEQAIQDDMFLSSIVHLSEAEQDKAIRQRRASAEARAAAAEQLVRIEKLKQLAAAGKLASFVQWIKEFLETDEKLVVFATHIHIQHAILDKFPGAARIFGEDNSKIRQENIDRFQNDPDCRLIVCSLIAAGEGLTLTAASKVAFVELGWTPASHDQAEARVHRIGQEADNITAYYFIATDTIDEPISELLDSKRSVVNSVTDGRGLEQNESIMEGLWEYLKQKAMQAQT
jgi:hypothetical protein